MPQCKMSKFVPAEPRPRRRPTPTQNEAIRRAVVEALNNGYGVRANGAIQWSMIYRTFSAEVRRLVVMDMRRTGFIELPENAHISRLIIYTANPISKERAKTITKYMKFWYKHNKLALARAGARLPVFRRPPASSGAASASSGAASASSGAASASSGVARTIAWLRAGRGYGIVRPVRRPGHRPLRRPGPPLRRPGPPQHRPGLPVRRPRRSKLHPRPPVRHQVTMRRLMNISIRSGLNSMRNIVEANLLTIIITLDLK